MAATGAVCTSSSSMDMNSTITHNAEPCADGEALDSSDDSTHSTDEAPVAPPAPPRRNFPMAPRPNCTHIVMVSMIVVENMNFSCHQSQPQGHLVSNRSGMYANHVDDIPDMQPISDAKVLTTDFRIISTQLTFCAITAAPPHDLAGCTFVSRINTQRRLRAVRWSHSIKSRTRTTRIHASKSF